MRTRVHYVPDCDDVSGNDTLAASVAEQDKVNCATCIHEMYEVGIYDERVWI